MTSPDQSPAPPQQSRSYLPEAYIDPVPWNPVALGREAREIASEGAQANLDHARFCALGTAAGVTAVEVSTGLIKEASPPALVETVMDWAGAGGYIVGAAGAIIAGAYYLRARRALMRDRLKK